MLWTIVPSDMLLDAEDTFAVAEMSVGRATVVVHVAADGSRRVERLLSTNPADYLRPEWQPGTPWAFGFEAGND